MVFWFPAEFTGFQEDFKFIAEMGFNFNLPTRNISLAVASRHRQRLERRNRLLRSLVPSHCSLVFVL